VLSDGWVCERADQDILVDMEMSSYTSAWQLQGDVRDCKTAFVWKGAPSDFVIAVIMMNILYSTNLKLLGPQVITAIWKSLKIRSLHARIPIFFLFSFFQVLYVYAKPDYDTGCC